MPRPRAQLNHATRSVVAVVENSTWAPEHGAASSNAAVTTHILALAASRPTPKRLPNADWAQGQISSGRTALRRGHAKESSLLNKNDTH